MHRIIFAIHGRQDFFLSLAFTRLLKEREPTNQRTFATVALLLSKHVETEFKPYLNSFDQVETIGRISYPHPHPVSMLRAIPRILEFRRAVKHLDLYPSDVLVAYSFREFVLNVLIRALKSKPRLVRVRKCDHAVELLATRSRPLGLYWNVWNMLFGFSPQRYRWLPNSDLVGSGTFVRDPYDFEFCLNPVHAVEPGGKQIAYPFAVLGATDAGALSVKDHAIVVLGERYPLQERMALGPFVRQFNTILDYIRRTFTQHRLVFKPRFSIDGLELDLGGYEIAYQDISLESLLLQDPSIEKVISFKSSGSFIATLYGKEGYLLYPMCEFSADLKNSLDAYFEMHRGAVWFVHQLDDLHKTRHGNPVHYLNRVKQLSQPLLDVLLRVENACPEETVLSHD